MLPPRFSFKFTEVNGKNPKFLVFIESSRTPPKWSHYWTLVAEGFFEDFVSLSE